MSGSPAPLSSGPNSRIDRVRPRRAHRPQRGMPGVGQPSARRRAGRAGEGAAAGAGPRGSWRQDTGRPPRTTAASAIRARHPRRPGERWVIVAAMSSRTCAKPGCNTSASATLTYDYSNRTAWVERLDDEAHPMRYDLCADHADAPPRAAGLGAPGPPGALPGRPPAVHRLLTSGASGARRVPCPGDRGRPRSSVGRAHGRAPLGPRRRRRSAGSSSRSSRHLARSRSWPPPATPGEDFDTIPLSVVALAQLGLRLGVLRRARTLVTRVKGNGLVVDLGFRARWSDLWYGGIPGLLAPVRRHPVALLAAPRAARQVRRATSRARPARSATAPTAPVGVRAARPDRGGAGAGLRGALLPGPDAAGASSSAGSPPSLAIGATAAGVRGRPTSSSSSSRASCSRAWCSACSPTAPVASARPSPPTSPSTWSPSWPCSPLDPPAARGMRR